jgi:heptosyltransferase-1
LISEIKAASGDSSPIEWKLPPEQLMALLRNADCIVGGDTGPLHLAVALETPAVALFGPTDPARNGPYRIDDSPGVDRRDIVVRSPRAVTSYKRGNQADPSMLDLEVDPVFEAVRRVVEARA